MKGEDISDKMNFVSSSQEEAIQNIKGAEMFNTTPDFFKENRTEFEPDIKRMELPRTATPTIAREIAQSPEHAAAVGPDADNLSFIEKIFNNYGKQQLAQGEAARVAAKGVDNQIGYISSRVSNKIGPERELQDLGWKKLRSKGTGADPFTEEDQAQLVSLKLQSKENFGQQDYGISGPWETLPGEVAAQVADIGALALRNKELIAGITAATTVATTTTGALIGSAAGGVGAIPGAATGFGIGIRSGLSTGYLAASFVDSYRTTAGSVYNELDDAVGDDGKPLNIDENTKAHLSHGVGVVSGAMSFITDKLMMKSVPVIKRLLGPGAVTKLVKSAQNSALRQSLISIGKVMAINGTEEGLQEITQIIGEEVGNSYDGKDVSFVNGLANAARKIESDPKYQQRVGSSVLVGSVTAGTMAATVNAVDTSQANVRGELAQQKLQREQERTKVAVEKKIKLARQEAIFDPSLRDPNVKVLPLRAGENVLPPRPKSDIIDTRPEVEHVTEVLDFQDAVDASAHVARATNLHNIDRNRETALRAQLIKERAGVAYVWIDQESVDKIAQDPKIIDQIKEKFGEVLGPNEDRIAKVRELIGLPEDTNNAPIRMPIQQYLGIHNDFPTISEYTKLHPEGPSPNSARVWAENFKQAQEQRAQVVQKLGVMSEKSIEERAQAVKITPEVDDQTLAQTLGTKEVADAYLARLDKNEAAVKVEVEQKAKETSAQFEENKQLQAENAKALAPEQQKQLADIANVRERVKALREYLPDDKGAEATLKKALDTPQPANDIFGEKDFLDQPTFSEAIEGVISDAEVRRFKDLEQKARLAIVDSIDESAQYEMNKVADVYEEMLTEGQIQIEFDRLENNPRVAIVEQFLNPKAEFRQTQRYQVDTDLTASHAKPGFPIFAMDERLFTDEQRSKYKGDPQLKKHKAIVKGGVSPDTAAILLGVKDGDTLLEILSNTPSRKDIAAQRTKALEADIRRKAEGIADLDHTAIAEAYHNKARNDLEIMKFMVEKSWATSKKGIKKIALPVPRIEDIQNQAENAIKKTKVGELNSNQFKAGERKSQRKAVTAWLDGDFLTASVNKEAAALNTELTIATMKATAQVNQVKRLVQRIESKEIQQELKDAGPIYQKAVDEILDVFNFSANKKDQSELGSYRKWVKQQIEAGVGNFEIPDRFSDIRESVSEMTVEQVVEVGNRLKTILHQARLKNKLFNKFGDEAIQVQHLEALASKLHDISIANPDYNIEKSVVRQERSKFERFVNVMSDLGSTLKNAEHILVNADNGKVGGLYNETIIGPLKGIGKYAGQGEQGKIADMSALGRQMEKIINNFGEAEWKKMHNTYVDIPEFKNSVKLNNGKLSIANLFMMLLNTGNDGNIQRLVDNFSDSKGFKTDIDTVMSVLERHLDHKHAAAAQQIMDMFKALYPRVVKLHEDMAGVTPEAVKTKPIMFKGKVYDGGYYPLLYASEMSYEKTRKRFDKRKAGLSGEDKFNLQDHFYADDMTNHRHTERRTGNDQPINLKMSSIGMGFEMIIHDLNFRKPINDALKVLTHPGIAQDLTSTVGVSDYNVLVNTAIEAAASVQMENNALHDFGKPWEAIFARGRQGIAAGYLVGNITSIAIQPVSFAFSAERMGVSGVKHLGETFNQFLQNPDLITSFYDLAGEINPGIFGFNEGIDENTRDILSELMPEKNLSSVTAPLDRMRKMVNKAGFKALGIIDQFQKVVVTVSAYKQFMAGDAPGHSLETINAMTPEERDHQAKIYASSVARLTLTSGSEIDRAPIQKVKELRNFTMFFNDARNVINNVGRSVRETRQNVQTKNYGMAARGAVAMLATTAIAKIYIDIIRGRSHPFDDEGDDLRQSDPEGWAKQFALYMAEGPIDATIGNIPFGRDIKYALDMRFFRRGQPVDVTTIDNKMLSDVGTTIKTLMNAMELIKGEQELKPSDKKSLGFMLSYATGGLPVNSYFQLNNALQKYQDGDFEKSLISDFIEKADKFLFEQKNKETSERVPEDVLKAIEDAKAQLEEATTPPDDAMNDIPINTKDVIKQIESGGDKWAKNPNSSAAGLYQFTEKTWRDIMKEAPELGLTANGRVSADTDQQERAMDWFTASNAQKLKDAGIETTIENIYAAHFLGAEKAVEVLTSNQTAKMKSIVSNDVMSSNGFANGMKVRDFKKWIASKINIANGQVASLDKVN